MLDTALCRLCTLTATLLVLLCTAAFAQEQPRMLGTLKADRILFLGNSITLHGIHEPYGWLIYCGMAASAVEKDYVHTLTAALDTRTGGHLRISPAATPAADGTPALPANIVNIAGTFERAYGDYTAARLQAQLDYKPDLVVLQCGENVVRDTFDAAKFEAGLRQLLADLQAAGSPQVFVTSQILGGGGPLDEIKRKLCAEDPAHRTYVDLSSFSKEEANYARSEPYYKGIIVGHPGDKGMGVIAQALLQAMLVKSGLEKPAAPPAP